MSIRKINKDHSINASTVAPPDETTLGTSADCDVNAPLDDALRSIPDTELRGATKTTDTIINDPLLFWTLHETPVLVDLHQFADGVTSTYKMKTGPQMAIRGRPLLIFALAPIIRQLVEYYSTATISGYIATFRRWWRMFDEVERLSIVDGTPTMLVNTVSDINGVYRQMALDDGMDHRTFTGFVRVVEIWRIENDCPPLYWLAPEKKDPKRLLPPQWQIDEYRFALKHKWFSACRRWEKTDQLISGVAPIDNNEGWLLENYLWFQSAIDAAGQARPGPAYLQTSTYAFKSRDLNAAVMLEGYYPSAEDIRVAFHLCLASTGWNPSVLLALDINDEFLVPHPKDPKRYLLYGYKARGDMEVITEGLFRSQGSAGVILQTLLHRTAGLRAQVQARLISLEKRYAKMQKVNVTARELNEIRQEIESLTHTVRSPWLYVNLNSSDVRHLNPNNFGRDETGGRFLRNIADEINTRQPDIKKIAYLKSGDFRDAFAGYAYRSSGGFILAVMKVLQHKQLRSTQRYLDNTVMNEESAQQYAGFSNAFFTEMITTGRVDPTIIAKLSRDHDITDKDRARLEQYRTLQRSRIGVGCKDPKNPPKRIAPNFKADGKRLCPTQRCTLCIENAVILSDSLPGLCKRLSELKHIKATVSVAVFETSSFAEELENTTSALTLFDKYDVETGINHWDAEIAANRHRVVDLEGI
ncbi:hypothetical protein NHH73_22370 [Oxalobacteraceae bacterium OTU3CINTB1]|nr:hypothetical protein NHH73_22370 [Oxalobacteraceae bacterium OTU3CINTB1]